MDTRLGSTDLGPLIEMIDDPVAGVPESALTTLTNISLKPEAWQKIRGKVNILLNEFDLNGNVEIARVRVPQGHW